MSRVVTLYTRAGCHLCDDAARLLDGLRGRLEFELEPVDIESDAALSNAFRWAVPVIAVNGAEVMRAPVRADRLEAALREALGGSLRGAEG